MASPGKKSFLLRISPELWADIERLAAQELRSANAQVEVLLREAMGRRGRWPRPTPRVSGSSDPPDNPAVTTKPDAVD